jgi:2-methylcitrate dehydratase PrpD
MGDQDFFPEMGTDSFPGQGTPVEQKSRIFQRDGGAWQRVEGVKVDSASVDAGNTGNTTKLRPGLVLLKTAGGKYVPADHADAPAVGAVTLVGILHHYLDMRDKSLTAVDKPAAVLIAGFVTDAQIIYVDGSYKATVQAALKLVDFR